MSGGWRFSVKAVEKNRSARHQLGRLIVKKNGATGKLGISLRLRQKLKTTRLAKTAVNATAIIFFTLTPPFF
ncbi:hypothetical protein AAGG52_19680 [Bacillus licheniformis]